MIIRAHATAKVLYQASRDIWVARLEYQDFDRETGRNIGHKKVDYVVYLHYDLNKTFKNLTSAVRYANKLVKTC